MNLAMLFVALVVAFADASQQSRLSLSRVASPTGQTAPGLPFSRVDRCFYKASKFWLRLI